MGKMQLLVHGIKKILEIFWCYVSNENGIFFRFTKDPKKTVRSHGVRQVDVCRPFGSESDSQKTPPLSKRLQASAIASQHISTGAWDSMGPSALKSKERSGKPTTSRLRDFSVRGFSMPLDKSRIQDRASGRAYAVHQSYVDLQVFTCMVLCPADRRKPTDSPCSLLLLFSRLCLALYSHTEDLFIKSSFPMLDCKIIFVGSYRTNCFLGFKYVQYLPRNMKYPQTKACFCTGSSHFLWCPLFGVLNLRWIIPIDIPVCVGLVPILVPWHLGFNMQLWCRLYTIEYTREGRPWHVIMIQAIYYRNL